MLESPAEGSSAKYEDDLQARLAILFDLVALGRIKFTEGVPQTVAQIKAVKRNPDGTFDLSTVGPLVRAACWTLDAHPLLQELAEGTAIECRRSSCRMWIGSAKAMPISLRIW